MCECVVKFSDPIEIRDFVTLATRQAFPIRVVVKGAVTGILYTLLCVFVFAAADGFRSANFNFADFLTTVVTGIIAGIIAVNLPRRERRNR